MKNKIDRTIEALESCLKVKASLFNSSPCKYIFTKNDNSIEEIVADDIFYAFKTLCGGDYVKELYIDGRYFKTCEIKDI